MQKSNYIMWFSIFFYWQKKIYKELDKGTSREGKNSHNNERAWAGKGREEKNIQQKIGWKRAIPDPKKFEKKHHKTNYQIFLIDNWGPSEFGLFTGSIWPKPLGIPNSRGWYKLHYMHVKTWPYLKEEEGQRSNVMQRMEQISNRLQTLLCFTNLSCPLEKIIGSTKMDGKRIFCRKQMLSYLEAFLLLDIAQEPTRPLFRTS